MGKRHDTLVDLFEDSTRRFAHRDLFGAKIDGAYRWSSYADFAARVTECRAALAQRGVDPGTTVAIISDNRPEWAVCAYATWLLGARVCPMYESQDDDDRAYILADSQAEVLFAARPEMLTAADSIPHRFHFGADGPGQFNALLTGSPAANGSVERTPGPGRDRRPSADDIALLIYTSGTTGRPKGVLLSHGNITSNVNAILDTGIIQPDDVSLAFLPWAHSFGQTGELHGMLASGAAMGLVEDRSTIVQNMAEVRPTLLFSVPRIFNTIYEAVQRQVSEAHALKRSLFAWSIRNAEHVREAQRRAASAGLLRTWLHALFDKLIFAGIRGRLGGRLRYAVSGGAPLSDEVNRFLDQVGIPVLEGYGLTETSPLVSVNLPGARKIGSVGLPIPGVEVTLGDRPDRAHPEQGEILVRGPNVMKGYFRKPDKTAQVLDPDGTFHTGDLGVIDDDGFIHVVGRIKEQFKLANGKYVAPSPIEDAIELSTYIDHAMLVGAGRPHTLAVVNIDPARVDHWAREHGLRVDSPLDDEQVEALIEGEVARQTRRFDKYARPCAVLLTNAPWDAAHGYLTPTLKLKRRALLDAYRAQIDRAYDRPARLR